MDNKDDAFTLFLIIAMLSYKKGKHALCLPEAMLKASDYN